MFGDRLRETISMANRRKPALARLRGRDWRLAALMLWAAVLLVNLAAALDLGAATLPSDSDIHSSLCLTGEAPDQPQPPVHSDHATGPHCPLCYIVAAGVLAPPNATAPLLVLAPSTGWSGPKSDVLAPPHADIRASSARPRAPPVLV
jgi:hypothetical protein